MKDAFFVLYMDTKNGYYIQKKSEINGNLIKINLCLKVFFYRSATLLFFYPYRNINA